MTLLSTTLTAMFPPEANGRTTLQVTVTKGNQEAARAYLDRLQDQGKSVYDALTVAILLSPEGCPGVSEATILPAP